MYCHILLISPNKRSPQFEDNWFLLYKCSLLIRVIGYDDDGPAPVSCGLFWAMHDDKSMMSILCFHNPPSPKRNNETLFILIPSRSRFTGVEVPDGDLGADPGILRGGGGGGGGSN